MARGPITWGQGGGLVLRVTRHAAGGFEAGEVQEMMDVTEILGRSS